MNLHQEWMTNNSMFGDDYENNLILSLAIERFNIQKASIEGYSVTIDGITEQVVIQEHTNPLNADRLDKKLHCDLDTLINTGSIIEFNNKIFLVMSEPVNNLAYISAKIVECNETLKWQDSIGFKYSIPCIATRSLLTKMDIKETNYAISLLQGEMNVFVSNNITTETIIALQRFYLGNYTYEVSGIDDISNIGIIKFTMKTSTKAESDNDTLRICNYKGEIDFKITNSDAELLVDDTLPITTQFTLNSNIINPPYTITYLSSDITKATVDSSGLITAVDVGSAIITATATALNNPTLSDSFNVTVSESVVDNYEIEILGDAEIPYGQSKDYTAVVRNNGIIDLNKPVTFSVIGSYASIISQDDDSCVVKNINDGICTLKAVLDIDESITKEKSIICKGVW